MPVDAALAEEISQVYKRTDTWTWFDNYVWPEFERFLPWYPEGAPEGGAATAADIQPIVFPKVDASTHPWKRNWKRDVMRAFLSRLNGLRAG